MKKSVISSLLLASALILPACGSSDNMSGVSVSDSGSVVVTFTVPDGMTVEEVIGSSLGDEHQMAISSASGEGGGMMTWYEVESGGLICKYEDYYRYGPDAEVTRATGVEAPGGGTMIASVPEEVFDPENADKLAEEYNIELNFGEN